MPICFSAPTRDSNKVVMEILEWTLKQFKLRNQYKVVVEREHTHEWKESERSILQIAFQDLENVRKQHMRQSSVPERNRDEETDQAEKDTKEFRVMVNKQFLNNHGEIKVYQMQRPDEAPYKIKGSYLRNCPIKLVTHTLLAETLEIPSCEAVLDFLKPQFGGLNGELWERRTGRHGLTRDKLSWTYISREEHVDGCDLDVVLRHPWSQTDYVIILTAQEGRDVPRVVERPFTLNICGNPTGSCSKGHSIWRLNGNSLEETRITAGSDISNGIISIGAPQRTSLNVICWQ
ncbi:hypothetical protein M408DRAFT_8316 [Serendipita vermifera MAFF 305830]|uniref:Uncharacterized protein n=1 Tax=Serendipita vermifera MAFF 305830 TaxID=933852 RepID=A0A0C2WSZ6_SERVB|nr:hypothetical protein M408DRAFT_8316 [Serendipita vermifera MAFF 305830]